MKSSPLKLKPRGTNESLNKSFHFQVQFSMFVFFDGAVLVEEEGTSSTDPRQQARDKPGRKLFFGGVWLCKFKREILEGWKEEAQAE